MVDGKRQPLNDRFNKTMRDLCADNKYVATMHTIHCTLLKLGQLTKATTVWRGMGGGKLPEQFTKGCEFSDIFAKGQGLSALGGIEFGFMSTSCCSVVTMPATAVQWHCATILPFLF